MRYNMIFLFVKVICLTGLRLVWLISKIAVVNFDKQAV